jgi:hypothetical protein
VLPGTTIMFGNPTDCLDVKDFVQMYSEVSQSAGYLKSSVVPLLAQHYEQLMEGLFAEYHAAAAAWTAGNSPEAEGVLLARDAAAFACLWHSCRCGQDVLNLAWETLYAGSTEQPRSSSWLTQTGAGLLCQLPPYLMAPAGQKPNILVGPRPCGCGRNDGNGLHIARATGWHPWPPPPEALRLMYVGGIYFPRVS